MNLLILTVDDDPNILELLRLYLEKDGYRVRGAASGEEALSLFRMETPDAVLLDLMLPGKSGLDVLREIRLASAVPVLILTARGDTFDKVVGLELGADDYIEKPFEPKELLARLKAVLRRARGELEPHGTEAVAGEPLATDLTIGSLTIDKTGHRVLVNRREVELAPREFELLVYLAEHPGRVFTRDQLLDGIWGVDFFGDNRTVDVHIRRLREKLDDEPHPDWELKTVWGVGYKLDIHRPEV